jgi:hypothetical protein
MTVSQDVMCVRMKKYAQNAHLEEIRTMSVSVEMDGLVRLVNVWNVIRIV